MANPLSGGQQVAVPEIAFENKSAKLSDQEALFHIAACDLAMRRDFCPAWNLEPWPCVLYRNVSELPAGSFYPMYILDHIGMEGAVGYHDNSLGYVYGRILAQDSYTATTDDHETKEMRLDPYCNQWREMPGGDFVAFEACDPVQGDRYPVEVTVAGETRTLMMANFILPAWFDKDAPGPYDYMGRLKQPFSMTPGGYLIIRKRGTNTVENVFADHSDHIESLVVQGQVPAFARIIAEVRKEHVALKMADRGSRTYRRHAAP